MNLLIYVLVLLLIFGAILYVIRILPIEPPFHTIAMVVVGVIFIIMLLSLVGGFYPTWRVP